MYQVIWSWKCAEATFIEEKVERKHNILLQDSTKIEKLDRTTFISNSE